MQTTTEDSENTRLQNNTDHDDTTTGEEIPTENNETITDQGKSGPETFLTI